MLLTSLNIINLIKWTWKYNYKKIYTGTRQNKKNTVEDKWKIDKDKGFVGDFSKWNYEKWKSAVSQFPLNFFTNCFLYRLKILLMMIINA